MEILIKNANYIITSNEACTITDSNGLVILNITKPGQYSFKATTDEVIISGELTLKYVISENF